mmetsp:Transcript_11697/g.17359  ORF Transcript_11697/g.17359 Transcript_11697/m.17359 type:complete len:406 (-) Transcript_11697:1741-2958(-)
MKRIKSQKIDLNNFIYGDAYSRIYLPYDQNDDIYGPILENKTSEIEKDMKKKNKSTKKLKVDSPVGKTTFVFRLHKEDHKRVYMYYDEEFEKDNEYLTIWNIQWRDSDFIKFQIELNNIQHDIIVYEEKYGDLINEYPVDLESFKKDTYREKQLNDETNSKFEFKLHADDNVCFCRHYYDTNNGYTDPKLYHKRMKNCEYLKYIIDEKILQHPIYVYERSGGVYIREHIVELMDFKKERFKIKETPKFKFAVQIADFLRVSDDYFKHADIELPLIIFIEKFYHSDFIKKHIELKNIQHEITVFELEENGKILKSYYVNINDFKNDAYGSKQEIRYEFDLNPDDNYRARMYHQKYHHDFLYFDKFEYKICSREFIKHQIKLNNIQSDIRVSFFENDQLRDHYVSPK